MNMFKPSKAKSIASYIAAVPKDRRDTIVFLHDFIRQTVPTLKPHFAINMLGYGSFPWPVISLANQKNYISIYVCAIIDGKYITEVYKKELGKVSVGKSCIRFKKIADINLSALKKVLQLAAKHPGLVA